jgi:hypothetical protein
MDQEEHMAQVSAQCDLFEEVLPWLLPTHWGRWVVYLDKIRAICDTEDKALHWAYESLDPAQPFIIVQVRERRPVLASAALAFGAAEDDRIEEKGADDEQDNGCRGSG